MALNAEIKEHGVMFTPESVRGILAGNKTQTRRIVKEKRFGLVAAGLDWQLWYDERIDAQISTPQLIRLRCPYGQVGERIWVRETWRNNWATVPGVEISGPGVQYRADGVTLGRVDADKSGIPDKRWRSSMMMPRWASRLLLQITEIRVQRVQSISAEDALAEGVSQSGFWDPQELNNKPFEERWWDDAHFWGAYPQLVYARWFQRLHGAGVHQANPWVWCISFRRIEP